MLATTAPAQVPAVQQPSSKTSTRPTGISMKVVDPSGDVVPGVKVSVKRISGEEVAQGTTNGDGVFEAIGLAPGHYTVECLPAQGWPCFSAARVFVKRGKVTEFEEKAMVPIIGTIIEVRRPEIKPKG